MPSISSVMLASILAMAAADAHMILLTPPPYGHPNNSPLDGTGSDFPCKGLSPGQGATTDMATGSQQTLSFTGGATHGGGSCQISLTKDIPATKSSKWQVIHSIEGGCPSAAGGNIGEDPNGTGATKFTYTIPDGIAAGPYTFAWTWFNKIGNREMYMNCASVKITSGSSKRDVNNVHANDTLAIPTLDERDTSFPDMFVANIPTTACQTVPAVDLQFPDAGSSVQKAGTGALGAPTGPQCSGGPAAAGGAGSGAASSSGGQGGSTGGASGASGSSGSGSSGGSGAGAGSGASGASSAASPSASAAGSASGTSKTSGSGMSGLSGGAASGAPSLAASSPTGSAPFANASSTGLAVSPAAASGASTSSPNAAAAAAPATAGTTSSSCSAAGQVVCSPDGKQIAECGSDLKVTWIPTAAGTVCKNGMMVAAKPKLARSAKFLRDWILNTGDDY